CRSRPSARWRSVATYAEERGRFTAGRLLAVKAVTDGDECGIGRSPDWLKMKNPGVCGGDARGGRGLETIQTEERSVVIAAGTYAFVYCGRDHVGYGFFNLAENGNIDGGDTGGVLYSGTAREEDNGWIFLEITFTVPKRDKFGSTRAIQDPCVDSSLKVHLPPDFGDGYPKQIPVADGVVTIMIRPQPGPPPSFIATPVYFIGET